MSIIVLIVVSLLLNVICFILIYILFTKTNDTEVQMDTLFTRTGNCLDELKKILHRIVKDFDTMKQKITEKMEQL